MGARIKPSNITTCSTRTLRADTRVPPLRLVITNDKRSAESFIKHEYNEQVCIKQNIDFTGSLPMPCATVRLVPILFGSPFAVALKL